jgi:gliding motility-associated lipoprotein GldD
VIKQEVVIPILDSSKQKKTLNTKYKFKLIDSKKMYGIIYDFEGDAASQLQFFVTDSVNHFMRGVLYFRNKPNADSLEPCLNFMREDVVHMIETMRWK